MVSQFMARRMRPDGSALGQRSFGLAATACSETTPGVAQTRRFPSTKRRPGIWR